jgi:EAL domain-containing protein (putative c-di-GMP-specific phosphodiesterase class I)
MADPPGSGDEARLASVEARTPKAAAPSARWTLESLVDADKQVRRMLIHPLPFRIGRLPGLDLVLPSQLVSKMHAEIYVENGSIRLRDLKSTNGTFVNCQAIADVPVCEGDILHFADFEFRVGRHEPAGDAALTGRDTGAATIALRRPLPHQFVGGTRELKELLQQGAVTMVFQPIVRTPGGAVTAYEALGRGLHPGLPQSPVELLRIAESLGVAGDLSRLFRRKAVEQFRDRTDVPLLFLNTHPAELDRPGLVESLEELRETAPHVDLILEIHESALALPSVISALRMRLSEINVGLAYDDFGAGQARLLELAEAPPHFLKFDMRFVSGIDRAPTSRQRLLASLVAAARELLVKTVAEGVETAEEAEVCTRVGFTHAQGYFYGRPAPAQALAGKTA